LVYVAGAPCLAALLGGCGNKSALAPNPTRYAWPDSFAYQVEYRAETRRGAVVDSSLEETESLRFAARYDGAYQIASEGVVKTAASDGRPSSAAPLEPADTVPFIVRLGRLGEFSDVERGCDPGMPACKEVPLSALPLELDHPAPPRLVAATRRRLGGHARLPGSNGRTQHERLAAHRLSGAAGHGDRRARILGGGVVLADQAVAPRGGRGRASRAAAARGTGRSAGGQGEADASVRGLVGRSGGAAGGARQ
jgi:hypothetical protein